MILKNYVTIQGWQVSELKLSGNELIAYALIFGFCQAKNKTKLSLGYISEWLGTTKRATIKILKRLENKDLIKGERKSGEATTYKVNEEAIDKAFKGGELCSPLTNEESSREGVNLVHSPHEQSSPNTYTYTHSYKTKKNIKEKIHEQLTPPPSVEDITKLEEELGL